MYLRGPPEDQFARLEKEKNYCQEEKKQLREEKRQLREEERQLRETFFQLRFGDARLKLQPSDGKNALGLYYDKSAHTISQDISGERHSLGLSPMFLASNRFQSIQTDQTIKSSRTWLGLMEWSTKQSWLRNCIVFQKNIFEGQFVLLPRTSL